jgi:hypothetical protein
VLSRIVLGFALVLLSAVLSHAGENVYVLRGSAFMRDNLVSVWRSEDAAKNGSQYEASYRPGRSLPGPILSRRNCAVVPGTRVLVKHEDWIGKAARLELVVALHITVLDGNERGCEGYIFRPKLDPGTQ